MSLGPTLHPQHALACWSYFHPFSSGSDSNSTKDIQAIIPLEPPLLAKFSTGL